ncbi:Zn(II)2Cys6 transcription factor [Aspergillus foveolatus]|uniref:Zn(II)2Cys6 transcription factor n=1 Tax=Aspergillus foveolatus TaxID=210207 RepID=UPI003CCC99E2
MSTRRYRSTVACHSCRSRKVRCSVNVTGIPCIRCSQDRAECVVDSGNETSRASRRHGSVRQRSRAVTSSPPNRIEPYTRNGTSVFPRHTVDSPAQPISSKSTRHHDIQDEERNGLEIAAAALGDPKRAGHIPFYTGDKTGITSTLSLLSSGESLPQHLFIPSRNSTSLSEEDRNYLASKGVLNLPSSDACQCLLQAYFRHVHTIMPIIEADQILHFFQAGRLEQYNLLLVWSVFFVAVNVRFESNESSHLLPRQGKKSFKSYWTTANEKKQCLYNNSGERDKIVLLQASLLLGFWHSEADEHSQPWYWSGISVSLCQMLGLHRNPDTPRYNTAIMDRQRHLWRRLWWTCFLRDRWLSLTLGRPLRIDLDDCDVPMPSVSDIIYDFRDVDPTVFAAFIPDDLPLLAEYWLRLIDLSKLLGKVLRAGAEPLGFICITYNSITSAQATFLKPEKPGPSNVLRAILIVLYRPCLTELSDDLSSTNQQWQESIWHKADSAASHTNDILEAMAQEGLLEYALPMTPPLLIPAMQMHLLNCRSGTSLSRRLRLNKLNACMMVMEEFQQVYTVASIYRGIFAKAIQLICPESAGTGGNENTAVTGSSSAPLRTGVSASTSAPIPVPPESAELDHQHVGTGATVGPELGQGAVLTDMVDDLLDETLPFNFWETWGQMWVDDCLGLPVHEDLAKLK